METFQSLPLKVSCICRTFASVAAYVFKNLLMTGCDTSFCPLTYFVACFRSSICVTQKTVKISFSLSGSSWRPQVLAPQKRRNARGQAWTAVVSQIFPKSPHRPQHLEVLCSQMEKVHCLIFLMFYFPIPVNCVEAIRSLTCEV